MTPDERAIMLADMMARETVTSWQSRIDAWTGSVSAHNMQDVVIAAAIEHLEHRGMVHVVERHDDGSVTFVWETDE